MLRGALLGEIATRAQALSLSPTGRFLITWYRKKRGDTEGTRVPLMGKKRRCGVVCVVCAARLRVSCGSGWSLLLRVVGHVVGHGRTLGQRTCGCGIGEVAHKLRLSTRRTTPRKPGPPFGSVTTRSWRVAGMGRRCSSSRTATFPLWPPDSQCRLVVVSGHALALAVLSSDSITFSMR